jgi:hypothetical protein
MKINDNLQQEITLYDYIELRYSDPINSLSLSNSKVFFGTMMGRLVYYDINKKKIKVFSDLCNEAIMGTSIDENNENLYCLIGDESITSYEINNDDNLTIRYKLYSQDEIHKDNCSSCFTMLNKNNVLMLYLKEPKSFDTPFQIYDCSYNIKIANKNNLENNEGKITMSNYIVPFEFVDDKFIFLEQSEGKVRKISIYDFRNNEKTEKEINNYSIGHISFLYLLRNNSFLIVNNYNQIDIIDEILSTNKTMTYINPTGEINAIYYYYDENNNDKLKIIFLDINSNIYEGEVNDNKLNILMHVNLNELNNIDSDMIKKGLFDMDFPYYLKANQNFIVVSCDYACLILKKM